MKLAIIGSRNLQVNNIDQYITDDITEIVSGGAKGIDNCARGFALAKGITLKEFLPDYKKYGRAAPIVRNKEIVNCSDTVLAFWDGKSHGTKNVIDYCKKSNKPIRIVILPSDKSSDK